MADDTHRPMRYAAIVIIVLVLAALLVPAVSTLDSLGYFGTKTYLLVLQDNTELRNTGGILAFMGSIDVRNGEPTNLELQYANNTYTNGTNSYANNTYTNSSNAIIKLDGPESFTIFYGTQYIRFHDMNVQYDFATFAPLYAAAYTQLTGQHADGVIAIDFTALQEFLKTTGPVTIGNQTLTWRNAIDQVHYLSATGTGFKTDLTEFLTKLGDKLVATAQTAGPVEKLLLLNTLKTLGQQGHILVYAPDTPLNGYDDGAIHQTTGDYLYVLSANSGGGKADLNVNKMITYDTRVNENGTLTSNLTITYQNNCSWDYNVFTTALVPNGAQLINTRYSSHALGPLVTRSDDLTEFTSYIFVGPNATANVTYTYSLPTATIGSAGVYSHYSLYVQKQAGINDYTLNTDVTLPHGAQLIRESNIGNGTVTSGDVQAEVIYR
jgi:hypothetical protein